MMIDKPIDNAKFIVLDHPVDNNIMNISQTLSAYEVSTAQVLKTKIETPNREFDIFCASQNDWLVLCADSELHLFDITTAKCSEYNPKKPQKPRGRHTEQQQMNKEDGKEKRPIPTIDKSDGRVVDMQFIPYTNVLVLLLSTGKILFYSLTNHFFHKEELLSPLEDCSLCIAPAYPVGHTACILDRQKLTIHLVAIPVLDEKDERNFREQCSSSMAITQTINFGKSSGLSFVVGGADSFVCFPRKKGGVVCEISLDFEEAELSELFTLQENLQMVRVVGNFIGALNQHGKLLLYDRDTRILCHTILSPQSIYRQTPEIANLLVCLVVDNGIDDLALLGKTADRLLQLRLSRQLRELLKYIRGITNKDIRSIPNLAMYYGRAFEALFGKIDSAKEHNEMRGLVYFLIGCPVEGQGYFLRAESILNAANAKSFAALVAIAGNAVADVSFPLKELEDGDAEDSDVKLDHGN